MKHVLIFIWCCLASGYGNAQHFTVSADKMNILYVGVENLITVVAENYTCKQLILSCRECEIKKIEDCKYIIEVNKEGRFDVVVKAKAGKGIKQVGIITYRAKFIPSPVARIAGKSEGLLNTSVFKSQLGIDAYFENLEMEAPLRVERYKIEFFRNNEAFFSESVSGAYFSVDVRNQMKTVKPGDKVAVTEISAIGPDSRSKRLKSIYLTLN